MKPGDDKKPLALVSKPHPHDVLCGRGGRTNLHKGNIWFRRLVRSNRALYKTCPKHTKLLVAKAVVKAVQGQDPPGRYLEADKTTGGWKEITYKRSLDKTSQALRERDPNPESGALTTTAREAAVSAAQDASLDLLTKATLRQAGLLNESSAESSSTKAETITEPLPSKKRKEPEQFQKPAWWSRGTPIPTPAQPNVNTMAAPAPQGMQPVLKRQKADQRQEEEAPLPLDALQTRQSSFFNFLSNTGIFGSKPAPQSSLMFGNSSNMQMKNRSQQTFNHMQMATSNHNASNFPLQQQQQQQQYYVSDPSGNDQAAMLQPLPIQQRNSLVDVFEPLPLEAAQGGGQGRNNLPNSGSTSSSITMDQMQVRQQMEMIKRNSIGGSATGSSDLGFVATQNMTENFAQHTSAPMNNEAVAVAPPRSGLTAQISDWLTPFFPSTGPEDGVQAPPPPEQDLQRSISSTLFNMARSPSQFLTSLKSGVTSMFMDSTPTQPMAMPAPPGSLTQNQSFGTRSASAKDSLLDDTEENPFETQLRQFPSR
ncbi:unnamed protein product [Cylindrotheca closterium]|uniref:DUF6824 domain-containing protein n=1 Tax=Cylindrotheca closterium TaxID=2856 RepID=A0AAD2FDN1_9STRA|nr:unnamed protein product [Cylindrotheca closterium]